MGLFHTGRQGSNPWSKNRGIQIGIKVSLAGGR
jgi:hypothetical protein